jgi:alkanesulfonate monooxygenase SsuD/methylene tetrahydromethanopterin reductase-like flavin-dependent oxidoreductase (luciferase family)
VAACAERIGFRGIWLTEIQHDLFLTLALSAEQRKSLELGTAVAIGIARSPTTLAHTARDIAQISGDILFSGCLIHLDALLPSCDAVARLG